MSANQQIVFIDSQVADYQLLANGVEPGTEVVILKSDSDGIAQITKVLRQRNNYTSIHIVSHGSPGCIYLGNTQLSLDTLTKYQRNLKTWFSSSSFIPYPSLLLYGCNVAAGDAGAEFIAKLHDITGASIAASTTPIGNVALGGNWELDVTDKAIDLAFNKAVQNSYAGILIEYNNNDTADQPITTATTISKTFDVTDNFIINDVTFGLNAGHTWRGNLEVVLESPDGTRVTVIGQDFGDNFDNYDLLLQDGAAGDINSGADELTAIPIYGGDRIADPSNPLSTFDREISVGTWTVEITNFNNPNITDTTRDLIYNSSQLNITGTTVPNGSVATTGTVFIDYNNDGSQQIKNDAEEVGYQGIAVKAYDASGNVVAQTTTDANGGYTLFTPENTPLRVEFDDLPEGFVNSSIAGESSVSDTFFIDGTSNTTAKFGIHRPSDVTTGNAADIGLVTVCYVEGIGSANASGIIIHNYNDAGSDTSIPIAPDYTVRATYQDVGTVNGLAYHRESDNLFAGTFYRRHSALKGTIDYINDGSANATTNNATGEAYTSIIYSIDDTGNVTEFARLDDITDPRGVVNDSSSGYWETDSVAFDNVGKLGLGDVELSEDSQSLWSVNLNDKKLYKLPVENNNDPLNPIPPSAEEIESYDFITQIINSGDDLGVNPQKNIRPFALSHKDGLVYVGMVNTAQYGASGTEGDGVDSDDLRAYVYTIDPNNPNAAPSQVLDIPLNYARDQVIRSTTDGSEAADWNPWTSSWPDPIVHYDTGQNPTYEVAHPQPMLTDIDFDPEGNMILGFRDRWGDQMGNGVRNPSDPNDTTLYTADSGGDMLLAEFDRTSDSWTIEDHVTDDGINGANDPDGEFFRNEFLEEGLNDSLQVHAETAQGGLSVVPGFTEVVTTAMDPTDAFSGGLEWFNTDEATGTFAGHFVTETVNDNPITVSGLEIFDNGDPGTAGKANGLGDLEFIAAPATIDIGDRIWLDTNKNGIQDVGESGVADGIQVELYDMDNGGTLFASTTTSNGNYFFTGLSPFTNYEVRLVASDFGTGQLLNSYEPTLFNIGSNDGLDSDASTKGGSGVPMIALKTGASGENDFSYDFGLTNTPPTYDYGDAPDAASGTGVGNYQTTDSDSGAKHIISNGLTIGNDVTADDGTLQNINADADRDNGVTFNGTLQQGDGSFTANVDVNLAETTLSASDDFDSASGYSGGDGWSSNTWIDSQEASPGNPNNGKIRVNNGDAPNQLEFRGRGTNANLYTFSRTFDFSGATDDATVSFKASQVNLDAGEELTITITDDQGTTPKVFTVDSNNAASGTDPSSSPTTTFTIPQNLLASGVTTITFQHDADLGGERVYIDDLNITAPGVEPANLVGWIDFNQDGEFNANESVRESVTSSGEVPLIWNSFPGIEDGSTYARFRLSSDSALDTIENGDSIGELSDGEVEDYVIGVGRDYGDAPDVVVGETGVNPGEYKTTQADDGASHGITNGLSIGSIVDPDSGLLQNTDADADDTNQSADEDGVTFTSSLSLDNDSYSVSVDVTNDTGEDALLTGWIDFNQSGTFDPGEESSVVFSDSGTQNLIWDSLPGLVEGTTYARFRLSNNFTTNSVTNTVPTTVSNPLFSENFDDPGDVFFNDPRNPDLHWNVNPGGTDTALADAQGQWTIADPVAHDRDGGGTNDQLEANSSPNALVTGSGGGNTDVDNSAGTAASGVTADGVTTIDSPHITLPNTADAVNLSLNYYLYSVNNDNNFTIELRDASDNSLLETLKDETTNPQNANWTPFTSFLLGNHLGKEVYLRFIATDGGNDGAIEVGVDDLNITYTTTQNVTVTEQVPVPLNPAGALETGEVEDYAINVGLDYGDAPDTTPGEGSGDYQTTKANGGASHIISDQLKIGSLTDADDTTLQNAAANADDIDGSDDEDGVTFSSNLEIDDSTYSATVKATNTTGSPAKLVGWVDFNQNGEFEPEEAVTADVPTGTNNADITLTWDDNAGNNGSNNLNGNGDLPGTGGLAGETILPGTSYARFRLSTDADFDGDNALGTAGDGEVEDYKLTVGIDYGDARDTGIGTGTSNYNTTESDNGASHIIDPNLSIGAATDADDGTLQNGNATADDGDGTDDEDGIANFSTLRTDDNAYSIDVTVNNNTSSAAKLVGWIDFDQSGTFDSDEAIVANVPIGTTNASPITLQWSNTDAATDNDIPIDITDGLTSARFRLSTDPNFDGDNAIGQATDGEVEDYQINIVGIDYGDAPDAASGEAKGNYKTTKADGGASHVMIDGLKFGATVDAEEGLLQNTAATADDTDSKGDENDEDGITFTAPLTTGDANGSYTVNVDFTNDTGGDARIIGWIDFNQDGIFQASEGTVADSDNDNTNGTQDFATSIFDTNATLTWNNLPASIPGGTTYARFRIAQGDDLTNFSTSTPNGALNSGEVEDYQIIVAGGNDFGDAANTGATDSYAAITTSHNIISGLSIGSIVDDDPSPTANAAADADDDVVNGTDDEDGVTFNSNLKTTDSTYSVAVDVVNTTGTNAELIGWIDFDGNGTFDKDEASDPFTVSSSGQVNLNWSNIPAGTQVGDTYARFRLNDNIVNLTDETPTGALDGGEVEDHKLTVVEVDYGDAPDIATGTGVGNYKTTDVDGGASHIIDNSLTIGSNIDADDGTLQNSAANADDTDPTNGTDDEDGIDSFDTIATNTDTYTIDVDVTNNLGGNADATLVGWIDFDRDGSFDADEAVSTTVSNGATSVSLTWDNTDVDTNNDIPSDIASGTTYARFRLSSDTLTTSDSVGSASDGEVEDYLIDIKNGVNGTGGSEVINLNTGTETTTTGDDFVIAGAGQDTLTGGAGIDCYHFNITSDGIDVITDFNVNEDKLDFRDIFNDELSSLSIPANSNPFDAGYVEAIAFGSGGTDTMIVVDTDSTDSGDDVLNKPVVLLRDTAVGDIDASDFIF